MMVAQLSESTAGRCCVSQEKTSASACAGAAPLRSSVGDTRGGGFGFLASVGVHMNQRRSGFVSLFFFRTRSVHE